MSIRYSQLFFQVKVYHRVKNWRGEGKLFLLKNGTIVGYAC